jgi:hypothetical protein
LEEFPWMRSKSILKFGSGMFIVCLIRFDFDFDFSGLMGLFEFYVFVESKKDWLDSFYFKLIIGFRCDFDDE